jgi:hypothetical protein
MILSKSQNYKHPIQEPIQVGHTDWTLDGRMYGLPTLFD